MKKFMIIIIAAGMISAPGLTGKPSHAAEFRAGVYSYLAWWKPGFRSIYTDYTSDPLLMVGPVLSVSAFDNFTFSALVITNRLTPSDAQYTEEFSDGSITVRNSITRLDIDCSLTYRVNNIIMVFAGFKKMDFREETSDNTNFTITGYNEDFSFLCKNETFTYGPGCGLVISYPLTANVSASAGTSLVYMRGTFSMNSFDVTNAPVISGSNITGNYYSFGNNSTLSVSYYIPGISTAIVLGGRFQVLKNYLDNSEKSMANDYYYGITLSAIYTF